MALHAQERGHRARVVPARILGRMAAGTMLTTHSRFWALGCGLLLSVHSPELKAQGPVRVPVPTDTAITSHRATRIADSLLRLMTLEEKLGQVTQAPAGYGQTGPT